MTLFILKYIFIASVFALYIIRCIRKAFCLCRQMPKFVIFTFRFSFLLKQCFGL